MKKKIAIFIYTTVLTVFLSACGGGDSDSGDTTPTPPIATPPATSVTTPMTVSANTINLSVDELGAVSTSINASNVNGSLSATNNYTGSGKVSVVVSGNTAKITFTASEMFNDKSEQFAVTIKDSKSSQTVNVTTNVSNVSATNKLSLLTSYAASLSQKSLFNDMTNIYRFYSSAAVLLGEISPADADSYQAQFSNTQMTAYSTLAASDTYSSAAINKIVSDYGSGLISEKDIDSVINGLQASAQAANTQLAATINEMATYSDKLPMVTPGELSMTITGLSSFVGNTSMGAYIDNEWVFNGEFVLIGKIISSTCAAE
ncbi:hypothetical protein [Shewanella frigidimarina]|uniref:hypothetical protein n=1 Tax=Shewanella frigidimarina TaxID=56812 RepID=UPI003D79CF02